MSIVTMIFVVFIFNMRLRSMFFTFSGTFSEIKD